jgi:NitT/TauT family transport system substrate-binding protein
MRRRLSLAGWLGAVLCFAIVNVASADEPLKIRLGWVSPTDFGPILFPKDGIAQHLGKSYTLVLTRFTGTPGVITAIATGDLDIGVFSYSSLGLAVQNAHMDDVRIIMDVEQDGVPGHYSSEFMVKKDSPIHSVADLKGKVLAAPGPGSANDMAIRVMLAKQGLVDKRDYTMIEVAFPNMKAMLADGKADLISAGSPARSFDPALRAIARTLFTERDAMGVTQLVMWGARQGFLAKNRPAIVDFLGDVLRSRHFYFDPANHAEAVKIVADFTHEAPENMSAWLFTDRDHFRDPNGVPNLAAVQANIDQMAKMGFLKGSIDVAKYADLSIVRDAAKSVGP